MEYEIYSGVKAKLGKITPKAIKALKESGLLDDGVIEGADAIDIYLDKDKLLLIIKAIFICGDTDLQTIEADYENISIEDVFNGYFDFFAKLTPSSERLSQLTKR